MAPEMRENVERRWVRGILETLGALVRVGPQLLFLFLILVILFDRFLPKYLSPGWNFEAPLLLLVTNAGFSIMAVAAIALRGYLANDSATLLLFIGGIR